MPPRPPASGRERSQAATTAPGRTPPADHVATGAGRADRLDAAIWALLSAIVLASIPIGFVSGDGIAHSAEFARGTWKWNPNHLLFEPAGAIWQALLPKLGFSRSGPDILKLLSIVSGAAALGLFRWRLAGPIAPRRAAANHATAWVAAGSAFSRLWISDEFHMIQMPFLVAAAAAAAALLDRPGRGLGILLGAALGVATLAFISNALLGAVLLALLLVVLYREFGRGRAIAAVGAAALAATLVAAAPLVVAAPKGVGLVRWITSYGGGEGGRVAEAQGASATVASVVVSAARAAYGSASTLVDLAPAVDAYRDEGRASGGVVLPAVAFVAGAAALGSGLLAAWRQRRTRAARAVLLLASAWIVAVIGFGILWNNSDDQFYFQLAIPIGLLAALVPLGAGAGRMSLAILSAGALLWNVGEGLERRILYPRTERVRVLGAAIAGAGLVVYPGNDEAARLLSFVPEAPGSSRLALTGIAAREPSAAGLARLESAVRETLDRGERVDLVAIFDVPRGRLPWKYLDALGYDQDAVRGVLGGFPIEASSRAVGPFTLRSIRPR